MIATDNNTTSAIPRLLTASQVAIVLQVSERSVRRLAASGSMPSVRLNVEGEKEGSRLLRFEQAAVREWITNQTKQ